MGRKDDDNAKNWSMSDMNEDQEKLETYYVVESTTYMTADEWARSEKMLKRNAASKGKVIGAVKSGKGYKVTVERPEKRKKK